MDGRTDGRRTDGRDATTTDGRGRTDGQRMDDDDWTDDGTDGRTEDDDDVTRRDTTRWTVR